MKCKLRTFKDIDCPLFNNPEDCWYNYKHRCSATKDLKRKQIKEKKKKWFGG